MPAEKAADAPSEGGDGGGGSSGAGARGMPRESALLIARQAVLHKSTTAESCRADRRERRGGGADTARVSCRAVDDSKDISKRAAAAARRKAAEAAKMVADAPRLAAESLQQQRDYVAKMASEKTARCGWALRGRGGAN